METRLKALSDDPTWREIFEGLTFTESLAMIWLAFAMFVLAPYEVVTLVRALVG